MAGTSPITLPNLITSAGYGLGLWWALGNGPGWAALASLVLDEVDGAAARALGQESEVGRVYDAEVDTVLAALAANRLGASIPATVAVGAAQAVAHASGIKPRFGGLRALVTLAALALEYQRRGSVRRVLLNPSRVARRKR